jgi:biotin carboxyl carrier protein
MAYELTLAEHDPHTVDVARHGRRATVTINGRAHQGSLRPLGDAYELTLDDRRARMWIVVDRDTIHVHAFGRAWTLELVDPVERALAGGPGGDVATAPMPGTVITVAAAPGDTVAAGERLVVIESMKMQSEIIATRDGVVDTVFVAVGDTFDRGAPLVSLAPDDDEEEGG